MTSTTSSTRAERGHRALGQDAHRLASRGRVGGLRPRIALLALCAAALGSGTLSEGVARAEGNAALAESLFREGKSLMDKKDFARACPKFAESLRQDASSGSALALGVCYAGLGKTASAWSAYLTAATLARRDGRKDREKAAAQRAAELEKKLAHVTLELSPETRALAGLEVKQDESAVGSAAWENAPVDPGVHKIVVTASHKKPFETEFTVDTTASSQVVKIPVLEDEYVAPPEQPSKPQTDKQTGDKPSALRTTGYVVGGVGLAALAVGGIFGAVAISKASDAKSHCPTPQCSDQNAVNDNHTAGTFADISTVTMSLGGVALVAGVIFVLTSPSGSAKTGQAPAAAPAPLYPMLGVGPQSATAGVGGAF